MKVFKFGGASVKDAEGVINLTQILKQFSEDDTVVVVSAMGKMTNAFEAVVHNYLYNPTDLNASIGFIEDYHTSIISELFLDISHPVFKIVESLFNDLKLLIKTNTATDYNFVYDQIIGFGELLSTTIVSQFLNYSGLKNTWLDVREYIKTDSNYRRANVDWLTTETLITPLKHNPSLYITQGFLASNSNCTTTLGREGSDYTAAIFAYALDAESVTIWKDVSGVLNADPRYFEETQLLEQLSYREAIELAFYGASVIHPKTLQPLQQKGITLFVKSFINPVAKGTRISAEQIMVPQTPCFIVKKNQILIHISSLDFSYIVEENISEIFNILHLSKMKVNLIQNSAISFSICVEDIFGNLNSILEQFQAEYKISYIPNVSLYTVRHYTDEAIHLIEKSKHILVQQRTQDTLQIVTK
ncbi:aspartate kinase III [Formosa agariphila KMM 3901]|uniref:Aspartokinase n=1 Tax=Formosa agariphila (strain DSM 15362 / KCTC 12365 / LMG 23005 / KMM 3901 / M-2Alg 35-1) TaxID=1347342 RepID=T2KGG2_FORAG|nr:aspartate kinase [Formosa agariphila]CDF77840.1 aspartate kinase III [Formosa agariphila KMM 3901]